MQVSDKAIAEYSVYHIHAGTSHADGYVGITKNVSLRFSQHGWKRKKCNPHLRNALNKYKGTLHFDVLASDLDQEAAELLEVMLRPRPNMGWNVAEGGNIPPSPKGKVRSPEYCANIAKAKTGENNPMFGKNIVFSEQHRQNLSKALKGKTSLLKGKSRPQLECPHCGKVGGAGGMYVHHFDRCWTKK